VISAPPTTEKKKLTKSERAKRSHGKLKEKALRKRSLTLATWSILPVVICLSQRLSHARVSLNFNLVKLRMAHYNSNRIHACLCYSDTCSNSRANTCQRRGLTASQGLFGSKAGALSVIQDNLERGEPARPGPHALAAEATHSSFCPIK